MQQVFYNARFITFDEKNPEAEAILVNDENIVFAGKKDEVFSLISISTQKVDLDGKVVLPAFFDLPQNIYFEIENRLKNADKEKFIEKNADLDDNFDKFENFEYYKSEFLKIQDEYIKRGILTILEKNVSEIEFIFWKKISEQNLLKIDVILYIDIIGANSVMDNFCSSYRKYKNHLRIGGYYISIDGSLYSKKAWLSKPYRGEGNYRGSLSVSFEALTYFIKQSFDEKKQLMVSASGDEAVNEFLICYEDSLAGKEKNECLKPIIDSCTLITKTQIEKLKSLSATPFFGSFNAREIIKVLGRRRARKINPVHIFEKFGLDFALGFDGNTNSFADVVLSVSNDKNSKNKVLSKAQRVNETLALQALISMPARASLDDSNKASLESGKIASFVVLDNFNPSNLNDAKVCESYFYGEKVFSL